MRINFINMGFVFYQDFQTLKTNKSMRPSASCVHQISTLFHEILKNLGISVRCTHVTFSLWELNNLELALSYQSQSKAIHMHNASSFKLWPFRSIWLIKMDSGNKNIEERGQIGDFIFLVISILVLPPSFKATLTIKYIIHVCDNK